MDKSANLSQICGEEDNIEEGDPLWCTPYRALQAAAKKLNIPANLKKQYLVDLITARELGNETVVKMLYDSAQKEKGDNTIHQKNVGKIQVNNGKKITITIKPPAAESSSSDLKTIKKDNSSRPSTSSDTTGLKFIKISQVVSKTKNTNKASTEIKHKNANFKDVENILTIASKEISDERIGNTNTDKLNEIKNNPIVKPLSIDSTKELDINGHPLENINLEADIENTKTLHALEKQTNLSDKNENCLLSEKPICVDETCTFDNITSQSKSEKVFNSEDSSAYLKSSINGELLEKMDNPQFIKELKEKTNLHFIDDNAIVNQDICLSENQYSTSVFLPSIDAESCITKQPFYDQNKLNLSHSLPDEQMKILNSILNAEPLENICDQDQQSEFLNISDFNAGMILNKNNYCENPSDIKTLNSIYTSDFNKLHYNNSAENLISSLDSTISHHQASDNFAHASYSDCGITENYLNSNHDAIQEYDNVVSDDYNHFADALVDNFSSIENMHFNSPSNMTSKNFNMVSSNVSQSNPRDDADLSCFFNRYGMLKETFKPMTENADSVLCFMCNWIGYFKELYSHVTKKHNDKITHTVKGIVAAKINILKLASGLYSEQQQTIIERFNYLYILRLKFKPPDTVCAVVLRLSESSKENEFPVMVHMQVTTNHSKKKLYWKGLVDDLIDPKRPTNVDIFANRKHGLFEVMLRELEMIPHDINENNINFQGLILTLNLYIQTRQDLLH